MPITLNATQVPLPMTFSGTAPDISAVAPGTGPYTSEMMGSGEKVPFTTTKFNKNALRLDLVSRYGAGFYFLATGGVLTAGSGLSLNVSKLHAEIDGTVQIPMTAASSTSIALTDNVRNHIWAKRDGTLEARTDLTQPSQAAAYLGSALCAAGVISSVDESGVLRSKMGMPWRQTADAGMPGDTPTAALAGMFTVTAGGTYLWDGTGYVAIDASVPISGLEDIASNRILGNNTGGAGPVLELTTAQVKAMLAVAVGDLANIAAATIVGNNGGGAGAPTALTAAQTRSLLDLVPGVHVQAFDADLTAIAALVSAANKMPYATGAGTWSLADLTAFARTLLDDADAQTFLKTLDARLLMAAIKAQGFGTFTESFEPATLNDGGTALVSQTLYLVRMPVYEGQSIAAVQMCAGGTAASGITRHWAAVFESLAAGTPRDFLVQSSSGSGAIAADTFRTWTMTAPHVVTAAQAAVGYLYGGVMVHASTMPTFQARDQFGWASGSPDPPLGGTSTTGCGATAPDPAAAIATGYPARAKQLWMRFLP